MTYDYQRLRDRRAFGFAVRMLHPDWGEDQQQTAVFQLMIEFYGHEYIRADYSSDLVIGKLFDEPLRQ